MLTTEDHLRSALRRLALPTAADREHEVLAAASGELESLAIAEEDRAIWLDNEAREWETTGTPSRDFQRVVRAALRAGDAIEIGDALGQHYFALHRSLSQHHLFDHAHAVNLLSHARLAAVLAREENLSAAMVASILEARDGRTPLSWSIVQDILNALGYPRTLTVDMMRELLDRDAENDVEVLGDATFAECAALLGASAREVHFPHDLERELLALFPLDDVAGDPLWTHQGGHLAMLHFCVAQVEFWDHKVSAIYEFSPRGQAANEVAKRFRDSGAYRASENMFLNNAKSAGRIDREWAWPKGPREAASAHALANVLEGLDSLAFAPRRHIAGLLRAWLTRIVRVSGGAALALPDRLDEAAAQALVASVASAPTSTRGVLEQRAVDALGKVIHGEGAVARGIGDSVNANNVSRLKLGDVEFEDGDRRIVAYEPHGGALRQVYVDGHARSLGQVLPRRVAGWEQAASTRGEWEVDVVLVAYGAEGVTLPAERVEPDGAADTRARVRYVTKTYEQLVAEAADRPVADAVNRYVLEPLRPAHVPDAVKQALLDRLP